MKINDDMVSKLMENFFVLNKGCSMVSKERFDTIFLYQEKIKQIEGDIVECGVWRGGFSIFLALMFPEKKIWMVDSFNGFQKLSDAKFTSYIRERFVDDGSSFNNYCKCSDDEVRKNMAEYDLYEGDRIKLLKGYVRDTLPTAPIDKISLLRVDVDAHSATLEVLTYLYPKVISGGLIIFDDTCIEGAKIAINTFLEENHLPTTLYDPNTNKQIELNKFMSPDISGGYMFKP